MGASYPASYGGSSRRSVTIAQVIGSIAAPIQTLSASGVFTSAVIAIPAGSIPDGGRVHIEAYVKRSGATTATASFDCYLGTAGTTGDSQVCVGVTVNQTNGHVGRMDTFAFFGTGNSFLAGGTSVPQSSTGGGSVVDRSTNINRASTMYVTLAMSSVNAPDTYALLSYRVTVER